MEFKRVYVMILAAAVAVSPGCVTPPEDGPARGDESRMAAEKPAPVEVAVDWILAPMPRGVDLRWISGGIDAGPIELDAAGLSPAGEARLAAVFEEACAGLPLFQRGAARIGTPALAATLDPVAIPAAQGYRLELGSHGIRATAHDADGLFYAAMTLKQLARQARAADAWPQGIIEDWPDFPNRGVMLDIARDKVPTLETLYSLVDRLAEWKINQFQLYTEHTYAYTGHDVVWRDASPMTAEDIQALDAYCRERYIMLVPNQNSFGHMGRWLQHKEYAHLAERPGGSDLCPTDPASIEFLRGLYAGMLPNFSAPYFNVGCDETYSIGKGRSADAVKQRGVGRVYLDFLLAIDRLCRANGKTMMFWGDIIMSHEALIPELPKDVIALEWGYEADHPFAAHGRKFAQSGIPFYVAPGTSSWNALAGRTDNAMANLLNAAENGLANGAQGYLITDWGDGGHWQYPPVSYLGYLYGASVSWCLETNRGVDIARALDVHAFEDAAGVMGRLAYDLGNAYQRTGALRGNQTSFYALLLTQRDVPLAQSWLKTISEQTMKDTLAYIDGVMAPLPDAQMERDDAALIVDEFALTADLMRFACRLGLARARAGGVAPAQLPGEAKAALAEELAPLITRYRQLWLRRNRPGGLDDSAGRFEALLAQLR